jgi:hypothetical protein
VRLLVGIVVGSIALVAVALLVRSPPPSPPASAATVAAEPEVAPVISEEPEPAPVGWVRGRAVDEGGRPLVGASMMLIDHTEAPAELDVALGALPPEARLLAAGPLLPCIVSRATSQAGGAFELPIPAGRAAKGVAGRMRVGDEEHVVGARALDASGVGDVTLSTRVVERVVEVRAKLYAVREALVRVRERLADGAERVWSRRTDAYGQTRVELDPSQSPLASVSSPSFAAEFVDLGGRTPGRVEVRCWWQAASVEGRVIDPAGVPLPGVEVSSRLSHDAHPDARAVCRTDADGRFALHGLRAGRPVEVTAETSPELLPVRTQVTPPARGFSLVVRAAGRLALAVTLTDAARRRLEARPLSASPAAWLELLEGGSTVDQRPTPVEGGAIFERLAPGRYLVVGMTHAPLQPERGVEVEVPPGREPTRVEVRLGPGRTITGKVLDQYGAPRRLRIGCSYAERGWCEGDRTDAQGRYRLENAPYLALWVHVGTHEHVHVPAGVDDVTLPDVEVFEQNCAGVGR